MNGSTQDGEIPKVEPRNYLTTDGPSLGAFKTLCSQTTPSDLYPLASNLTNNIPIYEGSTIDPSNHTLTTRLQNEWHHNLLSGPGVYIIRNFFPRTQHPLLHATNITYREIITSEKAQTEKKGDHFAASSANDRIWNSLGKHCHHSPQTFLQYYSNPLFPLVSESWLGPAYKLTAQVNIVHPSGAAQTAHRDYHLGFQTADSVVHWPKATHAASALLTLQGAVAHSDMPVESGPTRFLPFSQRFGEGYVAYRLPEFQRYFEESYVALPLGLGDAVFFSPAVFHAAGANGTEGTERSANLLQVSSAFGKAMESVDSLPLVERTWKGLREVFKKEGWSWEVEAFVKNVAEGYPFPTNLDRRPPAPGGMAPESEQGLLRRGLEEGWETVKVLQELTAMREASRA